MPEISEQLLADIREQLLARLGGFQASIPWEVPEVKRECEKIETILRRIDSRDLK